MDPNDSILDDQSSVSSPDTPDVTPASSPDTGDVPPSTPDDLSEEGTLFDAIQDAIKPSDPEKSSASDATPEDDKPDDPEAKAEGEAGEAGKAADPDTGENLTDEQAEKLDKELSPRAQHRVKQLLSERHELRTQVEQMKAIAAIGERTKPIVDFMQQNDIAEQDIDVLLGMAAQLRHGDFNGFLRTVQPYVDLANQYVGNALPPDLTEQVQKGYIAPEAAKELAQLRLQGQRQQQQQQTQAQKHAQEVTDLRGQAIRNAVIQWEQQTQAADPDFGKKQTVVRRFAQAIMQEHGAPTSPEQALQYAKTAYEEANKFIGEVQPAPQPTAARPSSTSQTSRTATPEPKSIEEAMQQAVASG